MQHGTLTPEREHFAYQPALDGLRALAVVAVLCYHHGASFAPGGFLGVDAFFVLSGFLITSLLALEFGRRGRISVPSFYLRRVRRLFPALLLLLFGVSAYAAFIAAPSELPSIRLDGIATLFYVENWRLVFSSQSYFEQFSAPSPLRHAWSLAIEEQWYLIWPIVFLGLLRVARGRVARVLPVIIGLAVASAALMIALYDPSKDPSRAYYGTDARAQALLVGSALALLLLRRPPLAKRWTRIALEIGGLSGIVIGVWLVTNTADTSSTLYRGGLLGAAVAFAFVIAAAVQPGSAVVGRVLALKPLVWLGLVSYGIYLFHWPVFLWLTPTRTGLGGNALFALRGAVTLAIAIVSYVLIEMPVRRGNLGMPQVRILAPTVAVLAIVAIVATTTSSTTTTDRADALQRDQPRDGSNPLEPARSDEVRVFLAGDSQAFKLGDTDHQLPFGLYQDSRTMLGCGIVGGENVVRGRVVPTSPTCHLWPDIYREGVEGMRPDVSVLFVGGWEVLDRQLADRRLEVFTDEYRAYLLDQLEVARGVLTPRGEPLVILGPACYDRPVFSENDVAAIQNDPARLDWVKGVFREFAAMNPTTVTYVDLEPLLCPGGEPRDTIAGTLVRDDGMHFTADGAKLVWEWLEPELRAVAEAHPVTPDR
jgi:peptidoglycan/LPS O-acetylase OafA/YrhL